MTVQAAIRNYPLCGMKLMNAKRGRPLFLIGRPIGRGHQRRFLCTSFDPNDRPHAALKGDASTAHIQPVRSGCVRAGFGLQDFQLQRRQSILHRPAGPVIDHLRPDEGSGGLRIGEFPGKTNGKQSVNRYHRYNSSTRDRAARSLEIVRGRQQESSSKSLVSLSPTGFGNRRKPSRW